MQLAKYVGVTAGCQRIVEIFAGSSGLSASEISALTLKHSAPPARLAVVNYVQDNPLPVMYWARLAAITRDFELMVAFVGMGLFSNPFPQMQLVRVTGG